MQPRQDSYTPKLASLLFAQGENPVSSEVRPNHFNGQPDNFKAMDPIQSKAKLVAVGAHITPAWIPFDLLCFEGAVIREVFLLDMPFIQAA